MSSYKTPKDVVILTMNAARINASLRVERLVALGFLAGAYIALGGLAGQIVIGGMTDQDEGTKRFANGAVFPLGLMLVLIAGGGLYTGNTAIMTPSFLSGRITIRDVLRNWGILYVSNFAGAASVAYFMAFETGLFDKSPYRDEAQRQAARMFENGFGEVLLRGIGGNWLVCLAVWLSYAANDIVGKVLALWFPTMAFVVIGFDHCIANMYFGTLGLMVDTPGMTFWKDFIWKNIIPATIGNTIGGAVMVGAFYWFTYIYQFPEEKLKERLGAMGIDEDDLPDIKNFSEVDGKQQTGVILDYK
mmetsp:Transcript_21206/g.46517  ORF Transcript_21206/g.46517 Transcript_21206/m.46517 type:complete len:303 (-) Transcript_21206:490-1398(-)